MARKLARHLAAVHLRIDSIEQAIRDSGRVSMAEIVRELREALEKRQRNPGQI
jgi:predicted kinase